jgi:hypothetical protein
MMKLLMSFIQMLSARLIGHKKHYLNVPDDILSWIKIDRIYKVYHIMPSAIITMIITLKLFPVLSSAYAAHLEKNSTIIPVTVIIFLIPILLLNGIIIEKILMKRNPAYRNYILQTEK